MKKVITTVLLLILAVSFTGCGKYKVGGLSNIEVNSFGEASMVINEGSVTPTSVGVVIDNESEFELESGNEYDLFIEKEEEDGWHSLVLNKEIANTAEALGFGKGKTEITLIWEYVYGGLPKGHYRVVKGFWTFDETKEGPEAYGDTFFLSAEFDID